MSATLSVSLLSKELAKVVQASHASEEFGSTLTPNIEFAAALADLLTACVEDIEQIGELDFRPFRPAIDGFSWLDIRTPDVKLDRLATRAILAAVHIVEKSELLQLTQTGGGLALSCQSGKSIAIPNTLETVLREILFWGNIELETADGKFVLTGRDAR